MCNPDQNAGREPGVEVGALNAAGLTNIVLVTDTGPPVPTLTSSVRVRSTVNSPPTHALAIMMAS